MIAYRQILRKDSFTQTFSMKQIDNLETGRGKKNIICGIPIGYDVLLAI